MTELVASIARSLVDDPSAVEVTEEQDAGGTVIKLKVA